jgi:hypothetical protein
LFNEMLGRSGILCFVHLRSLTRNNIAPFPQSSTGVECETVACQ